jgi:predicted RNA-binding protein with TRAM domain
MTNLDQILCLFNAEIEKLGDDYVIRIPDEEVEKEGLNEGEKYCVAFTRIGDEPKFSDERRDAPNKGPQPPVEKGEIRYVEIEDLGKQGDGIARAERGYVIIIPGSNIGEQVKIEITDVKPNFAMGNIIDDVLE